MKTIKLVCAGFGGQGVLTIGQMVAMMAMQKGLAVSWIPSYGPEMRGGTANCHVVIDESDVGSPIIADGITHLLVMNQPALDKFVSMMDKNGTIIINSSLIKDPKIPSGLTLIAVDSYQIAQDVGSIKVQNMAALGCLSKALDLFKLEEGLAVIEDKFKGKDTTLVQQNQAAFIKAYNIQAS
ncbi:MAG: 2-oxoacid:acceptor oxidoreductase family protein [Erysipelotrichaceae bacterium]